MVNYSSKICTKCYSVQEPASRFCDNCGKAFAATAATDGNISIVTKTFLKRQVAETRPLFWLCVIIVGMLGVFGFAQAGMYWADPAGSTPVQKPVNLISKSASDQSKPQTVPMTSEELATQPNDALDLNNSVFEMREGSSAQTQHTFNRRRITGYTKPQTEVAKTEKTETAANVTPEKVENPTVKQEPPVEKTAESNSATKKYIRGPMGGCYYISPSGSKRYVDRGLCS